MSTKHENQGETMHTRFVAIAALAVLPLSTAPAFAARPDFNYLQNELDGRGLCLGASGGKVAMVACDKSASQQWVASAGDIPGYNRLHTVDGGAATCLAVHPADRKNVLAIEACGEADNQQWHVERLRWGPHLMQLTNRATGAMRCVEALQTGLKMTPCSRRQAGHRWHSSYLPTM
jgi:hypothetical protein